MDKTMDKNTIIEGLKEIAKPYIQDQEAFDNLTEDTNFVDDLKINSANLVDIILDVEDKFDIVIEDKEMEDMMTVRSTIAIINKKLDNK